MNKVDYKDIEQSVSGIYGDDTDKVIEYLDIGNSKRDLILMYMELVSAADEGRALLIAAAKGIPED